MCAGAADPLGSLIVESNPSSARVFINDQYVGATPFATKLDSGHYTVKVTQVGYQDYTTTVAIFSNQITTVNPVLVPVPQTGTLSVASTPSQARVLVDDVMVGMTPYTGAVNAGSHNVKVTKINFNDYSTTVVIAADQTTTLTVNLVLVPQTGTVSVFSTPAGATVYIDGVYYGSAPVTADLAPASHAIKVSLAGYNDYIASVSVAAGQSLPLYVTLVQASGTFTATTAPTLMQATTTTTVSLPPQAGQGSVMLYSRPPGAKVYIDGTYIGIAPAGRRSVTAGTHAVLFTMEEYEDFPTSITVTADQTAEFIAAMVPAGQQGRATPQATKAPGFGLLLTVAGIAGSVVLGKRVKR